MHYQFVSMFRDPHYDYSIREYLAVGNFFSMVTGMEEKVP